MKRGSKTKERVVVLGQNEILYEGLKSIVAKVSKLQLVGAATEVEDLEELTHLHHPNVILLGLADGCDRELESVRLLTSQFSGLAILVLDNHPSLNRLTWFLMAGARGYFPVEAKLGELLDSLDFASPGLFTVDAHLADRFRPQLESPAHPASADNALGGRRLTPKEQELLQLLAEGKTNREIADALSLSISTVKNLSHRLFNKLGVKNRLQAVTMTYGPWLTGRWT